MPLPGKEVLIEKINKLLNTSPLKSERFGFKIPEVDNINNINNVNNIINMVNEDEDINEKDLDYVKEIDNPKFNIDFRNGSLQIAAIGRLLMDGHSIHEILDPKFSSKLLEEKGKEVKATFESNSEESGIYLFEAYEKILVSLTEDIDKRLSGKPLYPKDFLKEENSDLFLLSSMLKDARKEMEKIIHSGNFDIDNVKRNLNELYNKQTVICGKLSDYEDLFKDYMRMQGEILPDDSIDNKIYEEEIPDHYVKTSLKKVGKIMINNKIQELNPKEPFSSLEAVNLSDIEVQGLEESNDSTKIIENKINVYGSKYKEYILGKLLDESVYEKIFSYEIGGDDDVSVKFSDNSVLEASDIDVLEENEENIEANNLNNLTYDEIYKKIDELLDVKPMETKSYGINVNELRNEIKSAQGLSYERSALPTLIIGRMLMKGVSLDDCLDLNKNKEIRDETTKEVIESFKEGKENFSQYAFEGYYKVLEASHSYLMNRLNGHEKVEDFIYDDNLKNVLLINLISNDAFQEIIKVERKDISKEQKESIDSLSEEVYALGLYTRAFSNILKCSRDIYNMNPKDENYMMKSSISFALSNYSIVAYNDGVIDKNRLDDKNLQENGAHPCFVLCQGKANESDEIDNIPDIAKTKKKIENIAVSLLDTKKLNKIITIKDSEPNISNVSTLLEPPTIGKRVNKFRRTSDYTNEEIYEKIDELLDMKAIQLDSYGLNPDELNKEIKDGHVISYDRHTIPTLIIGRMLMKGARLEDCLDFNRIKDIRKETTEEVIQAFKEGGPDFNQYANDAFFKVMEVAHNNLKNRISGHERIEDFLFDDKLKDIFLIGTIGWDANQEIGKIQMVNPSTTHTKEDINSLVGKLNAITYYTNTFSDILNSSREIYRMDPEKNTKMSEHITNALGYYSVIVNNDEVIDSKENKLDDFDLHQKISVTCANKCLNKISSIEEIDNMPNVAKTKEQIENVALSLLDTKKLNKIITVKDNEPDVSNVNILLEPPTKDQKNIKDESSKYLTDEEIYQKVDELLDRNASAIENYGLKVDELQHELKGEKKITFDRTAIQTLIIGRMLMKGVKLEDCIDLNKKQKIREDTKNEVMALLRDNSSEFSQYASDGYYKVKQVIYDDLMNKLTGKEKVEDFLYNDELKNTLFLAEIVTDADQEFNNFKDEYPPTDVDPNEVEFFSLKTRPIAAYLDCFTKLFNSSRMIYKAYLNDDKNVEMSEALKNSLGFYTVIKSKNELMSGNSNSIDDYELHLKTNLLFVQNLENAIESVEIANISNLEKSKEQMRNIALSLLDSKKLNKIVKIENDEPSISDVNILLEPPTNEKDVITDYRENIVDVDYLSHKAEIERWYKSFEKTLIDKGYDTGDTVTSCYLKKITVERSKNDNGDMIRNTTFALDQEREEFDPSFLTKNFVLHNLSIDKKAILYNLARRGELALLPMDNDYLNISLVYPKDNGECGVSSFVNEIPAAENAMKDNRINKFIKDINNKNKARLYGERATKEKYIELVEEHFPGVKDPYLFARNITNYNDAREMEDRNDVLSEEEVTNRHIKEAWEAEVINDYNEHQNYYLNGYDIERSEQIKALQILYFDEDRLSPEYKHLLKENNLTAASAVEKRFVEASNNLYPNDAKEDIEPETKAEIVEAAQVKNEKIERLIKDGFVINGESGKYAYKENDKPWATIHKIAYDLLEGENIYIMQPNNDGTKLEPHKLVFIREEGSVKLEKEPIKITQELLEENPYVASSMVEDALLNVSNNLSTNEVNPQENMDLISAYKTRSEKIETLFKNGLIVNGAGDRYIIEENGKIGDKVHNLTKDLLSGKEIYVLQHNNDRTKLEPHKLSYSKEGGEIKLEEESRKLMYPHHKKDIIATLEKYKKYIDETKTTRRDSNEFKRLKTGLNLVIDSLNKSLDPAVFEKRIKAVKDLANEYYYAKLDESHNARRGKRFNIADSLRNLDFVKDGDSLVGLKVNKKAEDLARERIAGRIMKAYAKVITDSDSKKMRNIGTKLLDRDNKKFFEDGVKQLMNTKKFKELYGDKSLEFLLKKFDEDAVDLAVDVIVNHKALDKEKKNIVERKDDKVLKNGDADELRLIQ